MKYLIIILFLLTASPLLQGQPLAGAAKIDQILLAADSARATDNWYVALENYKEAYDQDDELPLRPTIALMNLKLRDLKAATRTYGIHFRRVDPADTTDNIHRYHYARALKMEGDYDEARTYFENFLEHNTDPGLDAMAKNELAGIKQFKDAATETGEVSLGNLGRTVNGSFSEYSPVFSQSSGMLYYSTWKSSAAVEQDGSEKAYSNIYMATVDDKGKWSKPEALGKEVNRPGVHTANPSLSTDGRRLFYNRIRMESNRIAEAKIYLSDVDDNGWKSGNPVAGINSNDYLALQPAVGELFGREVLFFVSDMDGGFGGKDIYYATYEGDGQFSSPVNLGETVNTPGDDVTPFYFEGTLYYATDGLPTMGGRDLFFTAWDGSKWSKPENLGPGFNSTVDDQSLSVYGDGLLGFMTSNREGGRSVKSKTCCDDIYAYQVASIYADLVVGLFNKDKEPLKQGTIQLQPIYNGSPQGLGSQKTRDDGNRFDFGLQLETNYQVVASHEGYYPDTVEISTLGLEESKEFQHVFFLRAIPPPPPPKEEVIEEGVAVTLENILYDFDDDKILPAAEGDLRVLQQVMETYPDMVIELSSHTDARGYDDANQRLSQRRAASARKWLIVKGGIAGPRIKTQGYGETVPQTVSARLAERYDFLNEGDILTEDFIDALPTKEQQEEAHQLNRRTEFKVLEGPTEFRIRRDLIERREPVEDRGTQPTARPTTVAPAPTPQKVQQRNDPPEINRFSSLFGQNKLEGLPILKFDKRELSLGEVARGGTRSFSYTFTNKGTAPAQIMLIQACSCTTYEHDNSKVYAPGESGTIKVTFDSTTKEEGETITIDIFLEQTDSRDVPILEMVEYTFELK